MANMKKGRMENWKAHGAHYSAKELGTLHIWLGCQRKYTQFTRYWMSHIHLIFLSTHKHSTIKANQQQNIVMLVSCCRCCYSRRIFKAKLNIIKPKQCRKWAMWMWVRRKKSNLLTQSKPNSFKFNGSSRSCVFSVYSRLVRRHCCM